MATIKYYPNLKKGQSKVYVRISLKRGKDFRLSTGQTIEDASDWSDTTNYPKKNSHNNKQLYSVLQKLEQYIEDEITNIERSTSKSINDLSSKWFKALILDYFSDTPIEDIDLLIPYAKNFYSSLKTKTFIRNGKSIRYKANTIAKYENFTRQLEDYEKHLGKQIKIIDVDNTFSKKFDDYLEKTKTLSVNTRGRYLKRLKTILHDAEVNGKKINPNYKEIKGYEDETIVTFLTFDEIDKIIDTPMPNKRLERAKDWLIIGCYTAQRISDMFRMKKSMIINENGNYYISMKQFKTTKQVKIPIHYKVENVLKKYGFDFPPNFSTDEQSNRSILSSLMKKVCETAEINEVVEGRFKGVIGKYPKSKLIQNHSCRRSFCSNFYGMSGWTNQMLMEISGHETEKSFLKYIDKESFHLSEKAAELFKKQKEDDLKEKIKLKILKHA